MMVIVCRAATEASSEGSLDTEEALVDSEIDKVNAVIPEMNQMLHMFFGAGGGAIPIKQTFSSNDKSCAEVELQLSQSMARRKDRARIGNPLTASERVPEDELVLEDAQWGGYGKAMKSAGKATSDWFTKDLPCTSLKYQIDTHKVGGLNTFNIVSFAGKTGDDKFDLHAFAKKVYLTGHYSVEAKALGVPVPVSGDFKAIATNVNISLPFSYSKAGCQVTSLKELRGGAIKVGKIKFDLKDVPGFVRDMLMPTVMTTKKLNTLLEEKALPMLAKKVNNITDQIFHPTAAAGKLRPFAKGMVINYCFGGKDKGEQGPQDSDDD